MSKHAALVVGASGGLASALIKKLLANGQHTRVHAVSRHAEPIPQEGVVWHQLDSGDEQQIVTLVSQLKASETFSLLVCCSGVLHSDSHPISLQPEKKLEDINAQSLLAYFQTNTVVPALWIKQGLALLKGKHPANLVCFSARVGSISDNRLGGWYGYRASKSALNMMIKTAQIEYRRRAPNVSLVSYHPGTVDTPLSAPFQTNVPQGKLFTAEFSASQLLDLLPDLQPAEAPYYLDWQGKLIPW